MDTSNKTVNSSTENVKIAQRKSPRKTPDNPVVWTEVSTDPMDEENY